MTVRAAPGQHASGRLAQSNPPKLAARRRQAWLYCGPVQLTLELTLPDPARQCAGWVILPRAGGARPNATLLGSLSSAGFATLALDLLDEVEARQPAAAFDMPRLVDRLLAVTRWLAQRPEASGLRLSYLAAGPSAGAALQASSELGNLIAAVVSLGGRVDLVTPGDLSAVTAPTLLVVSRRERLVLDANRAVERRLNAASQLVVAPSFRYLRQRLANPYGFEALLSVEWLTRHLGGQPVVVRRPPAVPSHGRAAAAASVLALMAALAAPPLTAEAAGSLAISGGTATYTGDSGNENLSVTRNSSTSYTFQSNNAITLSLGAGAAGAGCTISGDNLTITCPTGAFSVLHLNMNSGTDTVSLFLADSFAETTVDGGNLSDRLNIDDSATNIADGTTLTGVSYHRDFINPITYQNIESLSVLAEPSANPIRVFNTTASTTLNGGGGNDTITAHNGSFELDGFDGPTTFLGGNGTDSLVLSDSFDNTGTFYESGWPNPRAGVAQLTWHSGADIEALAISAGSGNDTMFAGNFTSGPATLSGGNGNDLFEGTARTGAQLRDDSILGGSGTDSLAVERSGSTAVNFVLTNFNVTGNGVDSYDSIQHITLYGGNGNDTLNASSYSDNPVVLFGGAGNDSLIGGLQSDSLNGDSGTADVVADTLGGAAANWVLQNGQLAGGGHGTDALGTIEQASLTGSGGNDRIDASLFNLGPVTIKAGAGADTVLGTTNAHNDSLDGDSQDDWLIATANGNFTLTNFQLTSPLGTDSLNGFDFVSLTGGSGSHRMDASAFNNLGSVTLDGEGGNDTLVGSANGDFLDGDTGTDRVEASANVDFYLNNTLLTGVGNDSLSGIDQASLTGGAGHNNFYLYDLTFIAVTVKGGAGNDTVWAGGSNGNVGDLYDGEGDIDWVSVSGDVNYTANDTLVSSSVQGNDTLTGIDNLQLVGGNGSNTFDARARTAWVQVFAGNGNDTLIGGSGFDRLDGQGDVDMVVESLDSAASNWQLASGALTGGRGSHILENIEQASLTGSGSADQINASAFTVGSVTLLGGGGNDTLHGGGANFADFLDGGTFTDRIVATANTNFTLGNGSLNSPALGNDILAGLDEASLTGGAGANNIDASAYNLGPVTLTGLDGNDTLLGGGGADSLVGGLDDDSLNGGGGDDTLTGGGDNDNIQGGSGSSDRLVETGGSFTLSDIALTGFAGTDVLGNIDQASLTGSNGSDSIVANSFTGGPVTLVGLDSNDTLGGGSGNDSLVGGDGVNWTLVSALSEFVPLSFSLSNTSLVITGRGSDALSDIQRASLVGGSNNDVFDASTFTGMVTLSGSDGQDLLRGSLGADSIIGGNGTDTLAATADVNMVLHATSLTGSGGFGTDQFSTIEVASLVGGSSGNILDAHEFGGSVSLFGLDGNDTLIGSPQSDSLHGGNDTDLATYFAGNNNVTLTGNNFQGVDNDTLTSIESFLVQGGAGPNIFDASGFGGPVQLDGGGGDDQLIGSPFNDTLLGAAGNDTLRGNDGNDSSNGGADADVVVDAGDQNFTLLNTLLTGSGTDTLAAFEQAVITGGLTSNLINVEAFSGTVRLDGAEGGDTLVVGAGGGTVTGGAGTDQINKIANANLTLTDAALTGNGTYALSSIEAASLTGGASGNNFNATAFTGSATLAGLAGSDTLTGGTGPDVLEGGSEDDTVTGGTGANSIDGGAGLNDRWLEVGNLNITLIAQGLPGEEIDTVTAVEFASLTGAAGDNIFNLTGFTGQATLDGAGGNDSLSGGNNPDSLFGNGGDDTLIGLASNDTLDGGGGTDQLFASGDLTFVLSDSRLDGTGPGGTGTDTLTSIEEAHLVGFGGSSFFDANSFGASQGAGGQTTLEGGGGSDTLFGGKKEDSLDGGPGSDSLVGGNGDDILTGGDTDTALAASSMDTLLGGSGNDLLDGVYGDDYLDGGANDDQLIGASGSDYMLGGEGNDLVTSAFDDLPGPGGNDTVSGGPGDDTLEGGPGADLLLEVGDVDYSFLTGSLMGGLGTDGLSGLEAASLTGGNSPNVFDMKTYTGTVTLRGGLGNDTFTATAQDDSIDGGGGTDKLVEAAGDFTLNDSLLTGRGTDSLLSIEEASLTGDTAPNLITAADFSGAVTLDGGAGADALIGALGGDSLVGGDEDDTLTGGLGDDQVLGGLGDNLLKETAPVTPSVQFTLTNSSLVGLGTDTLIETLAVSLTGSAQPDLFNITAFTGTATLLGGDGADSFQASAGYDSIDGGNETDLLTMAGDFDMRLTGPISDATLTVSDDGVELGVDTLANIEQVSLTGGGSGNTLDATDFAGEVILVGDLGNDLLRGALGSDSVLGGPGLDTVTGSLGDDLLDGGADIDLHVESALGLPAVNIILNNNLMTGLGNDVLQNLEFANLTGSENADTLSASAFTRSVTLFGAGGDDRLLGGTVHDSLDGGEGSDTLTGNDGSDTIFGGSGVGFDRLVESGNTNFTLTNFNLVGPSNDFLNGIEQASLTGGLSNNILDASAFTGGTVSLDGAAGSDSLVGSVNKDLLLGGSGNDTLRGGSGSDEMDGQEGELDRIVESGDLNFTLVNSSLTVSSSVTIVATDLVASFEEALFSGGLGSNVINTSGFSGTVTLLGGNGDDALVAGPGSDSVIGGPGSDSLTGNLGDDSLSGGPGDVDWLIETIDADFNLTDNQLLGLGTDTLDGFERVSLGGGASNNLLDASGFVGPVALSGGPGNDTLIGTAAGDTLDGGDEDDSLLGGLGDNSLVGGPGNDTLQTMGGEDTLVGGGDDDSLTGGGGSDQLDGGPGVDRLAEAGNANFSLSNTSFTGLGTSSVAGLELVTLVGGAGSNNFNLQGWTHNATIDGLAGADSLTVSGTSGDDVPVITDSSVAFGAITTDFTNLEHLAILGGEGDDSFALIALRAALAQPSAELHPLIAMTLSGGSGSDSFSLTPLPSVSIFVDGGDGPSGAVDELIFNSEGLFVEQEPGRLIPEGQQPITFNGIEQVSIINQLYRIFMSLINR